MDVGLCGEADKRAILMCNSCEEEMEDCECACCSGDTPPWLCIDCAEDVN